MLWVLKKTVSMTLYIITDGQENNYDFTKELSSEIRLLFFLLTYSIAHDPAVRFKQAHYSCLFDSTQPSYGPPCAKTCLRGFANNTGADQPAHMRRLISALVIRLSRSTISRLASSNISIF